MKFKSPVTKLKRTVAKKTGIPTTRAGRSGKVNRLTGGLSGALSSKGRRTTRRSGSKKGSHLITLALIIAGISGYFFGVTIGFVVFFVLFVLSFITIARNNSAKKDDIKSPNQGTRLKFSPTDPALEPISLGFTLRGLPQEKTTAPVGAYGMENDKYQLDLNQAQCSCNSWANRKHYPIGDPRRLCRHLVIAFRERDLIRGNDEWSEAIIKSGEGIPLKSWHARLQTAPEALVTEGDSAEWLNVFAREKLPGERILEASGPLTRYGWSVAESRWSFGQSAPGARELKKLLRDATS